MGNWPLCAMSNKRACSPGPAQLGRLEIHWNSGNASTAEGLSSSPSKSAVAGTVDVFWIALFCRLTSAQGLARHVSSIAPRRYPLGPCEFERTGPACLAINTGRHHHSRASGVRQGRRQKNGLRSGRNHFCSALKASSCPGSGNANRPFRPAARQTMGLWIPPVL